MNLYVEQVGTGPDLVLLHGWGLHGGLWGPFAEALAKDFRLSIVDLPGHGYSERPPQLTVDSMSLAIAEALQTSIGSPATVLGWSMGAMVALAMVERYPQRFNRLVWIAGTPAFTKHDDWSVGMEPETLAKFAQGLRQDYRATLKRFISLNGGRDGERALIKTLQQGVFDRGEPAVEMLDQGLAILRDSDMRNRLAAIRQPLLLVQGTHDRLVHPDTVDAIQGIRSAESQLLEGAGHAPFLAEPEKIARALTGFVL